MRLICPNCVAQYEVDEDVIPAEGRDVQCANCGHNWFQDSIQMLSPAADISTGTGDPDGDVPPELFNDLEGKLDTAFISARAPTAPDPNDMEPEQPRDDFRIEQETTTPSSRLGQDALDILHAEAEYSSGEKPPAINSQKTEDQDDNPAPTSEPDALTVKTTDNNNTDDQVKNIPEPQQAVEITPEPSEPVAEKDDLDEIRQRIMDLESQESHADHPQNDPIPNVTDDIIIPDIAPQETQTPRAGNPFSRPSARTTRSTGPAEQQYEENRPLEEDISAALDQAHSVEDDIETLISRQEQPKPEGEADSPIRATTPRPFPKLDADDPLYDTIEELSETRKDMFPDVDQLSSEIASDAEQNSYGHLASDSKAKSSSGGFLKGFKYAIYLCIIISALYLFQSTIVEYIPQAEGFLTLLTQSIDKLAGMIGPLLAPLVEKVTALIR